MEVNVNWMDPVWRNWLLTWPLLLFFFSIGQELRIEFSRHTDRRHLIAPIAAALGGMAAPALIYLGFSSFTGTPKSAWGVPMATDLPFVLIALSFFPSSHVKRLRIFLLALAIADDVGSILALGVVTSSHGGIHPTIIGTILGLAWGARGFDVMKKVAYFFALPLFLIATVSTTFDINTTVFGRPIVWELMLARMIGKPVGIVCGALVGYGILKMTHEHALRLRMRELVTAGVIGTLGLDVSLIFANVAIESPTQQSFAIMAIFLTIPISIVGVVIARYFLTRATAA